MSRGGGDGEFGLLSETNHERKRLAVLEQSAVLMTWLYIASLCLVRFFFLRDHNQYSTGDLTGNEKHNFMLGTSVI